jgi:CDP-diacylglycerol--serine O-phosphatidyltransferase
MLEGPHKKSWQSDYFVGVPAPAGALLVLLPVYLGFLGFGVGRAVAYGASCYTFMVALLLVSRLPVYSGKSAGAKIRRDMVMPLILLVVLYVLLLANFTWETLAASTILYLAFLPFSMRAYSRRAEREETKEDHVPESRS